MAIDRRDKGFAWVVLVSAILCNMLFSTICVFPSLILVNLTESFGVSTYQAGWITSINAFVVSLGGAPSGFLIERFGCKVIGLIGATLGCVSLVAASMSYNVIVFIITFSFLSGVFTSLTHLPPVVIIQYYFNKKRPLATGLSETGYSVGVFAIVPLIAFLIEYYGWRGAIMLVAGICLNICACMMFYSPIKINNTEKQEQSFKKDKELHSIPLEKDKKSLYIEKPEKKKELIFKEKSTENDKELHFIEQKKQESRIQKDSSVQKATKTTTSDDETACDCSLIKDKTFLMVAFSFALFQFGSELVFKASVPRAELDMGVSKVKASSTLSVLCIASLISRCASSFVANIPSVNKVLMYSFSIVLGGAVMIVSSFINDFMFNLVTTAAYGVTFGMACTVQVVVVVELLGVEKISRSQGLIFGLTGLMYLLTIPIAGWIYDTFHSFSMSFLLAGVIQCTGGLIALPLYCKTRTQKTGYNPEKQSLRRLEELQQNPVLIGSLQSLSNIK